MDQTHRVNAQDGHPQPGERSSLTGLFLSAGIMAAWLVLHIVGVHSFSLSSATVAFVPLMVAVQCWLSVGLFIVAHDAIHGSLVPQHPRLNTSIGRVAMTLYAGFHYEKFAAAHHAHHRGPGTKDDPDFSVSHPTSFWRWYTEFMLRHMSWRPVIFLNAVVAVHFFVFGASMVNLVLFYGIPSIASSAQLFYFGTFRPHRHRTDESFIDEHRTRSNEFGWLASFVSCYHFGYHHEHHLYPQEPWWRLPARRAALKTEQDLV